LDPFHIKTGYAFYWHNIKAIFSHRQFSGWGRKKTGRFARWLAQLFGGQAVLFEDGFIRSFDLGVNGSPSFSCVKDSTGIYYDANSPSDLENYLNSADLSGERLSDARRAIAIITQRNISKYNNAPFVKEGYLNPDFHNVLVVAQTAGDASLGYGFAGQFSSLDMIQSAMQENPGSTIYVKLHPDVLSGKKRSDIDVSEIPDACILLSENYNPLSLLKQVDKLYTKTSQMGFEALMLGKEVVCFGMPFYAGWGLTDDRVTLKRRAVKRSLEEVFAAAYLVYSEYFNPLTQQPCDIFEVLETITHYRQKYLDAPSHAYFFGFSWWKHRYVRLFFDEIKPENCHFINPFTRSHLAVAKKKGLLKHADSCAIYMWGKQPFSDVDRIAEEKNIPVYRVEDGFIRSVTLGSDLTQPYSLVVDRRGIYFDPSQPSDLEHILSSFECSPSMLKKAKQARAYIIDKKLSKYNLDNQFKIDAPTNQKVIVVPGQVGDDASIIFGAKGMGNLALLKRVRYNNPNAYVVYKPHPDVYVGNRLGSIDEAAARVYCDQIVTQVGIDSVIEVADEVHTMTSLVGFEALLRNKKVVTYGMPFYAGWGLTEDELSQTRRRRTLSLDELVAATLLVYPRYVSPLDNSMSDLFRVFVGLEVQKERIQNDGIYASVLKIRNTLVRFALSLIKIKKT